MESDATPRPTPESSTPPAAPPLRESGGLPDLQYFAAHLVAALLAAVALFFTAWFARHSPASPQVFRFLFEPWSLAGGAMDWQGLAWAIGAAGLFTIIGWFYLEGLELYLPPLALLALALCFGLGLSGFVLECLANPNLLTRPLIALALGALLCILVLRAWRRGRRSPESGVGGDPGYQECLIRRTLAADAFEATLVRPRALASRAFQAVAHTIIALITLCLFWHALLYPEVYWDSLILYLGYARQTFLEQGFPVKVTGHVGIGLGANYPHLYSVLGAGVAVAADHWSELPQRLFAPLAGLASTILIYQSALRITRHVNFALAVALLYRATPLLIIYDQYASDYALVLLFTAAFLFLSLMYIETALSSYLAAMTLCIALAMHINYLMGILWGSWLLTVIAAHVGMRSSAKVRALRDEAPWIHLNPRPTLADLIRSRRFWLVLLGAMVLGSTWHIRNWIVTGNPVYAFFYQTLGGRHINPEVMQAAALEWQRNGAGIGSLVPSGPNLKETVLTRLLASWVFFTTWSQAYQVGLLVMGFAAGGLLAWFGRLLVAPMAARRWGWLDPITLRFGLVLAALTLGLLAFHYVLAPFYLYQIIAIVPCLALLVTLARPWWRLRPWGWIFGFLALWIGILPGLVLAMMGYKLVGPIKLSRGSGGRIESPFTLYPLRHPLPPAEQFYRWRFGKAADMWTYLNQNLQGERLLTHENRNLVLHPTIEIVNLDEWNDRENMQSLWELDPLERVRRLIQQHNIRYYLYVSNEDAAPSNARMGAREWEGLGLAEQILDASDDSSSNTLYRLKLPPAKIEAATSTVTLAVDMTPTSGTQTVQTPEPPPTPTPQATPEITPAPTPPPPAATEAPTTATKTPAPAPPQPAPGPAAAPEVTSATLTMDSVTSATVTQPAAAVESTTSTQPAP